METSCKSEETESRAVVSSGDRSDIQRATMHADMPDKSVEVDAELLSMLSCEEVEGDKAEIEAAWNGAETIGGTKKEQDQSSACPDMDCSQTGECWSLCACVCASQLLLCYTRCDSIHMTCVVYMYTMYDVLQGNCAHGSPMSFSRLRYYVLV